MQKQGVRLSEIAGFPSEVADRLRDELSVTTATEFLDLARRFGSHLAGVAHVGPGELNELGKLVARAAPEAADELVRPEPADYPYRTGHDAPPPGRETFQDK